MKRVKFIVKYLWRCWFFANAAFVFLILYPAFYVLLAKKPWFPAAFKLMRFWARLIIFNPGMKVKVLQQPKIDKGKAYVFCPNHTSYLDIIVSYIIIPNYFHFMGKAELKKVPLFKIFFRSMNIVVDRKSIVASHRAYLRACYDLEHNISIAVFPEATIPLQAPQIKSFKNGPFKLAIEKQVPVVPITYINNWQLVPDAHRHDNPGYPGTIKVVIHEPVSTQGMTEADIPALKKRIHDEITAELKRHFPHLEWKADEKEIIEA